MQISNKLSVPWRYVHPQTDHVTFRSSECPQNFSLTLTIYYCDTLTLLQFFYCDIMTPNKWIVRPPQKWTVCHSVKFIHLFVLSN
jgi:hypothetical protein